jgi:hypothetical protein
MASVGDVVSGLSSLAQYDSLAIQPGSGEEWVIHNIYFDKSIQVQFYDGSNVLTFDWVTYLGSRPWRVFHLTNGRYLRLYALDTGTTLAGYDGVRIK